MKRLAAFFLILLLLTGCAAELPYDRYHAAEMKTAALETVDCNYRFAVEVQAAALSRIVETEGHLILDNTGEQPQFMLETRNNGAFTTIHGKDGILYYTSDDLIGQTTAGDDQNDALTRAWKPLSFAAEDFVNAELLNEDGQKVLYAMVAADRAAELMLEPIGEKIGMDLSAFTCNDLSVHATFTPDGYLASTELLLSMTAQFDGIDGIVYVVFEQTYNDPGSAVSPGFPSALETYPALTSGESAE